LVPTVSYFLTIGCQELLRTNRGSFPSELRGKCSRSFSKNFSKNQQLERTAPGFFPDPVDEVILKKGIGIINSQTSKASTLKKVRYLGAVCAQEGVPPVISGFSLGLGLDSSHDLSLKMMWI